MCRVNSGKVIKRMSSGFFEDVVSLRIVSISDISSDRPKLYERLCLLNVNHPCWTRK
jgi:hypothetical protein